MATSSALNDDAASAADVPWLTVDDQRQAHAAQARSVRRRSSSRRAVLVDELVAARIVDALCALPTPRQAAARRRRLARVRGVCRAFARVVPVVEPATLRTMYAMVCAHALFSNVAFASLRARERTIAYTFQCGRWLSPRHRHLRISPADPDGTSRRVGANNGVPSPCLALLRDAVQRLWQALYRARDPHWSLRQCLVAFDEKVPADRAQVLLQAANDAYLCEWHWCVVRHLERSYDLRAWTERV